MDLKGEANEKEIKRSPPEGRHDPAADGRQVRFDIRPLSENRVQQAQWLFRGLGRLGGHSRDTSTDTPRDFR